MNINKRCGRLTSRQTQGEEEKKKGKPGDLEKEKRNHRRQQGHAFLMYSMPPPQAWCWQPRGCEWGGREERKQWGEYESPQTATSPETLPPNDQGD